jgi:hypothetical protein
MDPAYPRQNFLTTTHSARLKRDVSWACIAIQ